MYNKTVTAKDAYKAFKILFGFFPMWAIYDDEHYRDAIRSVYSFIVKHQELEKEKNKKAYTESERFANALMRFIGDGSFPYRDFLQIPITEEDFVELRKTIYKLLKAEFEHLEDGNILLEK